MTIRTLIADDEPLARQRLRDLIEPVDWLRCIGEASDGPSSVEAIDALEPDLVFLDIRMPGATGLEVFEQASFAPHVVFTTAYDRYAVTAFELQAVDYLLKPFSEERFRQAVDRVHQVIQLGSTDGSARTRALSALNPDKELSRLFVRARGRILPLATESITRLEAQGDFVMIHAQSGPHLVSVRLKDLESRLQPDRFIRIHRSHVINLDQVASLQPYDGHRLLVRLIDGTEIVASKTGTKLLRQLVV